jgi:hypothetical protein
VHFEVNEGAATATCHDAGQIDLELLRFASVPLDFVDDSIVPKERVMLGFNVVLARALACAPLFVPAVAHAQGTAELASGAARYNISASPGAQEFTTLPYGSAANTTTSLALKGVSIQSNLRNFLAAKSMQCVTDAGRTPGPATGCVADFADMKLSSGALEGWARNASTLIDSDFITGGGLHAFTDELNIVNRAAAIGDTDDDPSGFAANVPQAAALGITATEGRITGGIGLGSDSQRRFNRGFYAQAGTIQLCTFCDYSTGAIRSLEIRGPHQYGVDTVNMSGGPALRLSAAGSINARKGDNSDDYQVLGVSSSNQINLGFGAAGIYTYTNVLPSGDEAETIGTAGLTFNGIWASLYHPKGYTLASLPGGQPNGTITYCTNCRKTGEGAGAGTGLPVVYTNGAWAAMTVATPTQ